MVDFKSLANKLYEAEDILKSVAAQGFWGEKLFEDHDAADEFQPWSEGDFIQSAFTLVRKQAGEAWYLIDEVFHKLLTEADRVQAAAEGGAA